MSGEGKRAMAIALRRMLLPAAAAIVLRAAPGLASPPQQLADGYAAIVDDRVITIGDVLEFVQPTRVQLMETFEGEELAKRLTEAVRSGLDKLVEQALIAEEFQKQGLTMPDRLVNDKVNEIVAQNFGGDRAAFLDELAAQRVTLDEWRERIKDRLMVTALRRQEVGDKIRISPGQVREHYDKNLDQYRQPEKVKLRMIQLNRGVSDEEQEVKRQQAVLIRGKVLAGEDFGDLAQDLSEGSRASKGGDWGWVEPRILRAELAKVAAVLKPGDVSDIIETDDGLYLLYVEDRKAASVTPFEEVRTDIEEKLRQAEAERLHAAWIARLRTKHSVQILMDNPAADL